jgi:hypothetical protein
MAGAALLAVLAWRVSVKRRGEAAPAPEARTRLPERLAPEEITPAEAEREAAPLSGYRRDVERPRPVQSPPAPEGPEALPEADDPGGPKSRRRDEKKTLPEIFRMPGEPKGASTAAPSPAPAAGPAGPGRGFAPFGRLVKCALVETLDSITARSEPIIAVVTHELDWNGEVVIPSGTEAYSYARPEPVVDAAGVGRLVDSGEWTLVLPPGPLGQENGRELVLRARAVDRSEAEVDGRGDARSWGPTDGADGLIGQTLSSMDDREVRLFAAAAVSGMSQGIAAVAERQQPAAGIAGALGATQVAPTLGNAAVASLGSGAVDVANELASRIRDEIAKRGTFVRVPAGKEFYLFVEQTIDPGAAEVGLRLPGRKAAP